MSDHELEKLLGGFAADTLTPEEKQALYTAALQDQQLFNALADEQALKELLADPDVRRRLLAAMKQPRPSVTGGAFSWLDWFRRPTGLAFAGGLAAAALAVVLGTKIYQESLKQATQPVANEETRPVPSPAPTPPVSRPVPAQVAEPQRKAKESLSPVTDPPKNDAAADRMAKREPAIPSRPQEQPASNGLRDKATVQSERDDHRRQVEPPAAAFSKSMEEPGTLADQIAQDIAQPKSSARGQAPMQAAVGAAKIGPVEPALSARALFYGEASLFVESGRRAQERERAMAPLAESTLPTRQPERKLDQSALAGTTTPLKPLGLRYSLIMVGPGGIDMEVDPATAVGKDDGPRLTIQTNDAGYLSVFYSRPPSEKLLPLYPLSGDGRVLGLKTVAIPLADLFAADQSAEQLRLLVYFSRQAHDATRALKADKNSRPVLIEQVDPGQPGAPAEQAVYVVDPGPVPAASLTTEFLLSIRP